MLAEIFLQQKFLQAYPEKYRSYIGKIYTIGIKKYLSGTWYKLNIQILQDVTKN
jgi:hypothetical protein